MHKLISRSPRSSQRGDTLVEVLIAIAVVSLILGGAYVTTNRSLQATRAAQERAIALKLAESQIERLKAQMSSSTGSVAILAIPETSDFCISYASNGPVTLPNAACILDTSGAAAGAGVEPAFRMAIRRTGFTFVLTETWYNVSGRNTDKLELRYRVYD